MDLPARSDATPSLGLRCALRLLAAAVSIWTAACARPAARAPVARRIEPEVRAVLDAHAARARASRPGTVTLLLVADGGGAPVKQAPAPPEPWTIVSVGVPFAPGMLGDAQRIWLRDARGAAVPIRTEALAVWPVDRSIRSALVAFRSALKPGERAIYTLAYGAPPADAPPGDAPRPSQQGAAIAGAAPSKAAPPDPALQPNPDGPIAALLPPSWYAASQAIGPQLPAMDDGRFPGFESGIERGLDIMAPAYDSYGVSCGGKHRTYYDGPHALYQRFIRNGDAGRYRRARAEAAWYRQNELRFSPDRAVAVHVCHKSAWEPRVPLHWEVLRRTLGQGMLDDYLLTGDLAAREAVIATGEAIRQNLAALTTGKEDILEVTERNLAWTMMSLSSYYALDPRPEVRSALTGLMDRAVSWQRRGASGAFEHDLSRADPEECERGPRGASPFMTALLVDALMDYRALTGDPRVGEVVTRAAAWLETSAMTSDHKAFRYLWGCETDPYDDSGTADLNLLIVPVFGAAYTLTGEARWLAVGDAMADVGVREMRVRQPKQWNQAMRGFGRYLGYRASAISAPPLGERAARVAP